MELATDAFKLEALELQPWLQKKLPELLKQPETPYNEDGLNFYLLIAEKLLKEYEKITRFLKSSHGEGHIQRECLASLIFVKHLNNLSHREKLGAIITGLVHDLGIEVSPKYQKPNEFGHAEAGAMLLYIAGKSIGLDSLDESMFLQSILSVFDHEMRNKDKIVVLGGKKFWLKPGIELVDEKLFIIQYLARKSDQTEGCNIWFIVRNLFAALQALDKEHVDYDDQYGYHIVKFKETLRLDKENGEFIQGSKIGHMYSFVQNQLTPSRFSCFDDGFPIVKEVVTFNAGQLKELLDYVVEIYNNQTKMVSEEDMALVRKVLTKGAGKNDEVELLLDAMDSLDEKTKFAWLMVLIRLSEMALAWAEFMKEKLGDDILEAMPIFPIIGNPIEALSFDWEK